jgi:hypothetical protein
LNGKYLATGLTIICFVTSFSQELKLLNGNALVYQDSSRVVKIAEIDPAKGEFFQGWGMINSHEVFFAFNYQDDSEPSSSLRVFNLRDRKSRAVGEVGNAFDSFFQINGDRLVFGWLNRLYLGKLDSAEWSPIGGESGIHEVQVGEGGPDLFPFWIDCRTIGYVRLSSPDLTIHKVKIKD